MRKNRRVLKYRIGYRIGDCAAACKLQGDVGLTDFAENCFENAKAAEAEVANAEIGDLMPARPDQQKSA